MTEPEEMNDYCETYKVITCGKRRFILRVIENEIKILKGDLDKVRTGVMTSSWAEGEYWCLKGEIGGYMISDVISPDEYIGYMMDMELIFRDLLDIKSIKEKL